MWVTKVNYNHIFPVTIPWAAECFFFKWHVIRDVSASLTFHHTKYISRLLQFTGFCVFLRSSFKLRNPQPFVQGGSNMTGTNCDFFTHNQSRSYLNHLVPTTLTTIFFKHVYHSWGSSRNILGVTKVWPMTFSCPGIDACGSGSCDDFPVLGFPIHRETNRNLYSPAVN